MPTIFCEMCGSTEHKGDEDFGEILSETYHTCPSCGACGGTHDPACFALDAYED